MPNLFAIGPHAEGECQVGAAARQDEIPVSRGEEARYRKWVEVLRPFRRPIVIQAGEVWPAGNCVSPGCTYQLGDTIFVIKYLFPYNLPK
jgi:hypothetical protein